MNSNSDAESVISVQHLTRHYGQKLALNEVTLTVPRGVVLGLVGANGAGKTTLIKHLLGLLCAREGVVRVFGMDPVAHPVEVLGRLGYLSEDRDLPPWISAIVLLSIKWGIAVSALAYSCRKGHITWRFALALLLGWCVVTGSLIWVLPTWQTGGAWKAMGVALLVPLGRLAVCPLAVALNRHR